MYVRVCLKIMHGVYLLCVQIPRSNNRAHVNHKYAHKHCRIFYHCNKTADKMKKLQNFTKFFTSEIFKHATENKNGILRKKREKRIKCLQKNVSLAVLRHRKNIK